MLTGAREERHRIVAKKLYKVLESEGGEISVRDLRRRYPAIALDEVEILVERVREDGSSIHGLVFERTEAGALGGRPSKVLRWASAKTAKTAKTGATGERR